MPPTSKCSLGDIEGSLHDDVRSNVVGIRGESSRARRVARANVAGSVVQTAILADAAKEEVGRNRTRGREAGDLRLLS